MHHCSPETRCPCPSHRDRTSDHDILVFPSPRVRAETRPCTCTFNQSLTATHLHLPTHETCSPTGHSSDQHKKLLFQIRNGETHVTFICLILVDGKVWTKILTVLSKTGMGRQINMLDTSIGYIHWTHPLQLSARTHGKLTCCPEKAQT